MEIGRIWISAGGGKPLRYDVLKKIPEVPGRPGASIIGQEDDGETLMKDEMRRLRARNCRSTYNWLFILRRFVHIISQKLSYTLLYISASP